MDFLNRKISTLAGLLVLLAITTAIGYFVIYQISEITKIRIETIQKEIQLK